MLFPQLVRIVERYLREHVEPLPPASVLDVCPVALLRLGDRAAGRGDPPDASQGEAPEVPRYEASRGPGSTAEVDFWTSRDVREVVAQPPELRRGRHRQKWEQSAAYVLDTHPAVEAFVKNAGLGFAIPYLHNGQAHDYVPDFIVRLKRQPRVHLILETKGYDPLEEVKRPPPRALGRRRERRRQLRSWPTSITKRVADIPSLLTAG